jgi:hypothetical protein
MRISYKMQDTRHVRPLRCGDRDETGPGPLVHRKRREQYRICTHPLDGALFSGDPPGGITTNALTVFYHARPLVWTEATFGLGYICGKGDTDKTMVRAASRGV